MPSVALGKFEAIRSLSWKGLGKKDDLDSVRDCITINAQGIEILVLDLLHWGKAKMAYYDSLDRREQGGHVLHNIFVGNFFAENVLGIFSGESRVILPHLSSLSLSEVSFEAAVEEMQHVLNITQLRSLKLRNCRYSLALLDTIVRGPQTVRLRSFELVIDVEACFFQGVRIQQHDVSISRFLNSFQGLEDLYLRTTYSIDWAFIAQSILNHLSTLNRLITQGRPVDLLCNDLKILYENANSACIEKDSLSYNVRAAMGIHYENPKDRIYILNLTYFLGSRFWGSSSKSRL